MSKRTAYEIRMWSGITGALVSLIALPFADSGGVQVALLGVMLGGLVVACAAAAWLDWDSANEEPTP